MALQFVEVFGPEVVWEACLKVVAERPHRRKLPQLPPEVITIL